ncbi:molybdate ABC transporter substrate-binding protein [Microbacterium sp. cx-55]|uniref:molybdate ABC transporter substrate-binding protein n=1 Tax=Microbacterium sp. cx-55 TaxID=2875948 RepID=UPI001CBFCA54|nr:molybdate ABC transporter substrate-binding protein [Microbacterium sp. cx-55]MBZ4487960.1 molybdate ABC transporter substrate-binding protein [Microbacterium sp. cx-55]UGB34630.1 molybdate ABC transporter substrate-binding protein [Microbacterium sp. cx-55]
MRRRAALAALLATTAFLAAGCAGSTAPAASTAASDELTGSLTISAAASLGTAFDEIAAAFEAQHPGVDVRPISYDGSSTLANQIIEGAPVDVFASADEKNMAKVVDAGLAADPTLFASNTLVIVVPAGNPAGISSLADLAAPGATVVLCAPEVPCGAASQTLLANAGVTVTPASAEQNVTAVLTKVAEGEADAGLVYATDALGNADVESIVPDGAADVVNRYPIVALTDAPDADAAAAFVAFVAGDEGRAILARLGFGPA